MRPEDVPLECDFKCKQLLISYSIDLIEVVNKKGAKNHNVSPFLLNIFRIDVYTYRDLTTKKHIACQNYLYINGGADGMQETRHVK